MNNTIDTPYFVTDLIPLITKGQVRRIKSEAAFKQKHQKQFDSLTKREVEVLILLANGLTNNKVSDVLFISRNTVEVHHKNLNRKLQVHNIIQLYQYAQAFDLI